MQHAKWNEDKVVICFQISLLMNGKSQWITPEQAVESCSAVFGGLEIMFQWAVMLSGYYLLR